MVRTRNEAGYGLNYGIFRGKKSRFGSNEQERLALSIYSLCITDAMYDNFRNFGSIASQPNLL
jgi:hypothetical protein